VYFRWQLVVADEVAVGLFFLDFGSKSSFQRSCKLISSGVARFVGAWGGYSQWPPVTEIVTLQKMTLIGFHFTWLLNFKFVEHRKSIASFKIFIPPPPPPPPKGPGRRPGGGPRGPPPGRRPGPFGGGGGGGGINILNEAIDFLCSTNLKLRSHVKWNPINVIFWRVTISVTGGHCEYPPQAPTNLATPLDMSLHDLWNDDLLPKSRKNSPTATSSATTNCHLKYTENLYCFNVT